MTIIGWFNLASTVPYHASQMYARNVTAFLHHLVKDGKLQLKLDDEIIRETLVTRGGEVVNARVREFFSLPALATAGGSRRTNGADGPDYRICTCSCWRHSSDLK